MKVLQRGHRYELPHRDGPGTTVIQYVNKEPGQETEGIQQQDLLRMMLDRHRYCNNCLPHPNNVRIQYHLRMALVLHEARALERKVEKGGLLPEYLSVDKDGHYELVATMPQAQAEATPRLNPHRQDWDRECKHSSGEPPTSPPAGFWVPDEKPKQRKGKKRR